MRNIYALMKREMKSYFSSPLAYAIIVIFLTLSAIGFIRMIIFHLSRPNLSLTEGILAPLAMVEAIILTIILPAISMRLLSEERKGGTAELLLTSPISTLQLVLGKYFGALSILIMMLLLTFPFSIFLFLKGSPELGPLLSGYLGLLLIGGIFLSIGLFTSSITENQIISFLSCFALLLILWIVDNIRVIGGPFLSELLKNISIIESLRDFSLGILDTKNFVLYLSIISFFLFLTQRVIDSHRWR